MRVLAGASLIALLLTACAPTPAPPSGPDGSPMAPSASLPPVVSATPESPSAVALPTPYPLRGPLLEQGRLSDVVDELVAVAGDAPVLRLDVTFSSVTIVVLTDDERTASYRWEDGVIDTAATDLEYFDQASFSPDAYPLDAVGHMFDVADLMGVRGAPVYQVQQYREGEIWQTISSRPESVTVFFRIDASAVPFLGESSTADIRAGLDAVVGDDEQVAEFGMAPDEGYWATVVTDAGAVTRRRTGGVPLLEAPAAGLGRTPTFDGSLLHAEAISKALAERRADPTEGCRVEVDQRHEIGGEPKPVMTIDCGGTTTFADLEGDDVTEVVTGG